MRNDIVRLATRYIDPCERNSRVMVHDADVKDIISVIMHADQYSAESTRRFAAFLKGRDDLQTLRNVWRFVRRTIKYQRDEEGHEVVKTPGCTLADRYGDCKSMSVMTGSLLRALGFPFVYRVAYYDPAEPQQGHIYAVVKYSEREIIVDPVHWEFNAQEPYWKKEDYPVTAAAAALSGPPAGGRWLPWAIGIGAALWFLKSQKLRPDEH